MRAVAIDLAALADTGPIWRDWLEDARRRFRVDVTALDEELPNWGQLLERLVVLAFQRLIVTNRLLQVPYETLRVVLDDPDPLLQVFDFYLVLGEFALE